MNNKNNETRTSNNKENNTVNRNNYVNRVSNEFLSNIGKNYEIDTKEDPQLYELLKGISMLHASKAYEDEQLLEGAFKSIKYNLNQEFDIAPLGIISLKCHDTIQLKKNFIFRSNESVYKTIDDFYVHNVELIKTSVVLQYDQYYLEIKLQGKVKGRLEFFSHMDLINDIFQENDTLIARGFNGNNYNCERKIHGKFFENQNCRYMTTFVIDFIEFENQLTLYVPVNNRLNNLFNYPIMINHVIVANKFEFISTQMEDIISIPEDMIPIQIHSLSTINGDILPHKKENINGWHIEEYNGNLFTNTHVPTIARMTCKNRIPNTKFCQPETFIPSTLTEWTITPIAENLNLDFISYISSNAVELFKYLCDICNLQYMNFHQEETIIQKFYDNKCVYEKGTKIHIKLINKNYIMLKIIENEINQYHNIEINTGENS